MIRELEDHKSQNKSHQIWKQSKIESLLGTKDKDRLPQSQKVFLDVK